MFKECTPSSHTTTTNSLYFIHNSCINLNDINNSAYDPVEVVQSSTVIWNMKTPFQNSVVFKKVMMANIVVRETFVTLQRF